MTTGFRASAKRDPWFGMLSVMAPFIGWFLSLAFFSLRSVLDLTFLNLYVFPLTLICGIGFAVAAWKRHEKHWALLWIGLILNSVLLVFLLLYTWG